METAFQSIIDRLQLFVDQTGMTMSQFADICGIPRPTLSQLFTGRTKSINDVLLTKFATAFPRLNVAWLLFGKGDMLEDPNIEISEPQPGNTKAEVAPEYDGTHIINDKTAESSSASQIGHGANGDTGDISMLASDSFTPEIPYTLPEPDRSRPMRKASRSGADPAESHGTCRPNAVKIIVLYDDGTFESFNPSRI